MYAKFLTLIICILFYFLSHNQGSGSVFANQSSTPKKETKQTIYAEVLSGTGHDRGSQSSGSSGALQVPRCNQECKIETLKEIGIIPEIAESLVINCKALADDPRHCILVGASIVKNESSGGKRCRAYSCFGIVGDHKYNSYSDATLHFAGKYQKWWRNADDMSFFYPPRGQVSRSRYCTSEHSSGSSLGCPNGLKISTIIFNKLSKIF